MFEVNHSIFRNKKVHVDELRLLHSNKDTYIMTRQIFVKICLRDSNKLSRVLKSEAEVMKSPTKPYSS